jgi:hypothetical protein
MPINMSRSLWPLWVAAFFTCYGQINPPADSRPRIGRILGTAVHPDGTHAGAIEIESLTPGNPNGIVLTSQVDGSFQSELLPAGLYRIGVDLGINRQPDEAYGRTYYPAGSDPSEASVIEITPALPEQRIHFVLPPRRSSVKMHGTVVDEDGRREAFVDVYFMPVGGYSTAQLWTRPDGTYTTTHPGSVSYQIRAESRDAQYKAGPVLVDAADLEKPILLVLQPVPTKPSRYTGCSVPRRHRI